MSHERDAAKELLKGIQYIVDMALSKTTKIYDGIIISSGTDGRWNVQFHGEVHALKPYGSIVPKPGMIVKVQIPDNNMSLAFFI